MEVLSPQRNLGLGDILSLLESEFKNTKRAFQCTDVETDIVACSSVLSKEAIILTRNSCLQMARNDLDLFVMAQINALRTPAAVRSPASHDQEDFRRHAHMKFFLRSIQVCQKVMVPL